MKTTSDKNKIPHSTLKKYEAAARKGALREPKRRGPPSLLPQEAETNLRD
ncbi:hypothetical protein PI124_g4493 [Phytophthora idaei]|nr:hypothetical protein PI125_g4082 [Phytophthora idaei]KAG3166387.1 hypothetical protein PI126_g4201 [Phytophthora idaei]KAG3250873.1 hypothetical protein PI124_g4493 [Phytophthora idaei]